MQKYINNVQNTNGDAEVGARVFVYFHGTTTLATLYADDGVTTIANPVITDSVGMFYFSINNGNYDLLITYGTESQTITNLRFEDSINPIGFGAVGDGVTDDAAAIQAAIDYAKTLTTGSWNINGVVTIDLVGKTYAVGTHLNFDQCSNIVMRNGGIKAIGTLSDYVMYVWNTGAYHACNNLSFYNLNINGNNLAGGFVFRNTYHCTVEDCSITQFTSNGIMLSRDAGPGTNGNFRAVGNAIRQAAENDTWSGKFVDVGGGTTNGRGVGININTADCVITRNVFNECMVCLYINYLFNCQISDNHMFGPWRTTGDAGFAISNCANNGSGLIRVTTSVAHHMETGDVIEITGVTGTTEANAWWVVTNVNATQIDLQSSTFTSAYVGGGHAIPYNYSMLMGEVNNVSGVIFTGNYFDTTNVVAWNSPNCQYGNNLFTANARFVLVSGAVGETASGFVFVGNRLSFAPEFKTTGSNTWASTILSTISGNWAFDTGQWFPSSACVTHDFRVGGRSTLAGASIAPHLQIYAPDANAGATFLRSSADSNPPRVQIGKSRGADLGTFSALLSGDDLANLTFFGDDGADYSNIGADIKVEATENWSTTKFGTKMSFRTCANGGTTNAVRAYLTSDGLFIVPGTSATPVANGEMTFEKTSNTQLTIKVKGSDGTVRSAVLTLS